MKNRAILIFLMPFLMGGMQKPEASKAPESTHYEILGISRDATSEEIRKAYLKLSRIYHPDRCQGKSIIDQTVAEEKYKNITHSYAVLSDEDQKSAYDKILLSRYQPQAASNNDENADRYFDVTPCNYEAAKKVMLKLGYGHIVSQEDKDSALMYYVLNLKSAKSDPKKIKEFKKAIDALIKQGAHVRLRDRYTCGHNTILFYAIDADEYDLVQTLLNQGVSHNEESSLNTRPLHLAQSVAMARLLISAGANIKRAVLQDLPVLDYVIMTQDKEDDESVQVLEYLLQQGADPSEKNYQDGNDALLRLVDLLFLGDSNTFLNRVKQKATLLIRYGASVTSRNKKDETVWTYLECKMKSRKASSVYHQFNAFLKEELEKKEASEKHQSTSYTATSHEGEAQQAYATISALRAGKVVSQQQKNEALMHCIKKYLKVADYKKDVPYLLIQGADIRFKDDSFEQKTIMYFALKHDEVALVAYLLGRGVNPNEQTSRSTRPLWLAKNVPMVQLLINFGADIHLKGPNNFWPLLFYHIDAYKTVESVNVLKYLLECDADSCEGVDNVCPLLMLIHRLEDMEFKIAKKKALLLLKHGAILTDAINGELDRNSQLIYSSALSKYKKFKKFLERNKYSNI